MSGKYDDIIRLSRPTSERHPRMPISERAAIFSPFAALAGHSAAIMETARLTDRRMELDEDSKSKLDLKQQMLAEVIDQQPEVTVTWFRPDGQKDGGSYASTAGRLKKVDCMERVMVLADGTKIPLDDVLDIESGCFRRIPQEET